MKQLCLAAALMLGACGDSGSSVSAEIGAVGQCTSDSLEALDMVFNEVTGFLGAIPGPFPAGVTYTPPDYAITGTFGSIAGSVISTDDISDGIDAGESASASWNLTPPGGGTLSGNGTFTLDRTTAVVFAIGGGGSVINGTCILNATNVDLELDLSTSLGPVGSFDFDAVTPSGPFSGTMTFDGSDIALVEGTFLGIPLTFRIDLDTFEPVF
jgi:hypothetical protein